MKVGDLIVVDPEQVLMISGYEVGLIVGKKPIDPDDPYETQFRVMWECGKISYPSQGYLECYTVVNEDR